jgi:hypothetical protein
MASVSNVNVEWIKSQKGNDQLVVESYLFVSNGKGKAVNVRYWVCSTVGCKVKAKTEGTRLIDLSGLMNGNDHGHENNCSELTSRGVKVRNFR